MVTWPSFPGCHPLRQSPVALERQERLQADVNIMKLFSSSLTPRNGTVVEFLFILSGIERNERERKINAKTSFAICEISFHFIS